MMMMMMMITEKILHNNIQYTKLLHTTYCNEPFNFQSFATTTESCQLIYVRASAEQ